VTPFKTHKIANPPKPEVTTTKEELTELYRTMAFYRRFEIQCDVMYKAQKIRGFCHLYDGQEAIVVGQEAAIKKTDSVITAYRDHCHQLGRGDTAQSVFGELMRKEIGCSRGKGGSMHMYFPENKFYGGNGIVGAQVPLGGGLAFAHKMRNDGGVAVASFGDGAANQGQIFETANMAALWKLPLIFVIENNGYAMGTSVDRGAASTAYYTRGDYVPGIWCDGMDVLAVKKAFEFAREFCVSGKGPIFLEADTYRYHGHSMSDPGTSYRSKEEVDGVRRDRDPLVSCKKRLLAQGWSTEKDILALEKDIRKEIEAASKAAEDAKELPVGQMFEDIYRNSSPPFIRSVDHAKSKYVHAKNHYTP
jgi:pyruvate dehydrogenase E1 component alpha subunit